MNLPVKGILCRLIQVDRTYIAFLEELIIIESIAVEHFADIAAFEGEGLVDVNESVEETKLGPNLTCKIVRIRQSGLENATDSGIYQINLLFDEAEINAEAELGIKIGVKLAFAIPSVMSRTSSLEINTS